jgi:CysZ protein
MRAFRIWHPARHGVMILLSDAFAAVSETFSRPLRSVLLKSAGLTLVFLIGLGAVLWFVLSLTAAHMPWQWAETALQALGGIGIVLALVFLLPPVTSLVAGLFLDDIAERVERKAFPDDPPGQALPFLRSLGLAVKFFAAVVLANIVAVVLLLVPGLNLVAFLLANGYLLGREYFEFAAMRHRSFQSARMMRLDHAARILLAGLIIAVFVAIPVVNLATPLFATAFMVRYHKRLSGRG